MPRVPTLERRVRATPIAGVRRSTDAPIEAFGGGAASGRGQGQQIQKFGQGVAKGLSGVASGLSKIAERERQIADKAFAKQNDRELSTAQQKALLAGRNLLLNDSGDSNKVAEEVWNKELANLSSAPNGDTQKFAFDESRKDRLNDLRNKIAVHTFTERNKFYDLNEKASVDNYIAEGVENVGNDIEIDKKLNKLKEVMADRTDRLGRDKALAKDDLLQATSRFHASVVNAYLVGGKSVEAKEYFKNNSEEVAPAARQQINKIIKSSTDIAKADTLAQDAIKFGSVGKAVESLDNKKNLDPFVKQKAIDMIRERFTIAKAEKKAVQDGTYEAMANLMRPTPARPATEDSPAVPEIPAKTLHEVQQQYPAQYALLNEKLKGTLKKNYEQNIIPVDRPNSRERYIEFIGLSDLQISGLSTADYESRYASQLNDVHRAKTDSRFARARTSGADTIKLSKFSTYKGQLARVWAESGKGRLKVNKPNKLESEFIEGVVDMVEDFEINGPPQGKRKATQTELNTVFNQSIANRHFEQKAGFFSGPIGVKKNAILTDEQRSRSFVPIERIPKEGRVIAEGLLDKVKFQGTPQEKKRVVEMLYAAELDRDQDRIRELLGLKAPAAQDRDVQSGATSILAGPSPLTPLDFRRNR